MTMIPTPYAPTPATSAPNDNADLGVRVPPARPRPGDHRRRFFLGLPNLHSIRGSKPRIPDNYVAALNRVREIGPEWLLGSHIMPIQGRERIHQVVTTYRDATQWMWDQSIRHIDKGYTPVELQLKLRNLPEHLWDPPYTVPTYGTPWTAVPEFFTGWVSWFSGDATDLLPTEPHLKAERLVALMGGTGRVLDEAKRHLADDDPQFAAELARLAGRSPRKSLTALPCEACCGSPQ